MSLKEFRKYILPQLEAAKELGVLCPHVEKAIIEEYKALKEKGVKACRL